MFCSVFCLMYLWLSVLTGLCSPRRDRQPEQQPRRSAGQRWSHLQLGAQPPGRNVQRLGSFFFLHHFIFNYCFVFVSSMSIWHLLKCTGHICMYASSVMIYIQVIKQVFTQSVYFHCVCNRNR